MRFVIVVLPLLLMVCAGCTSSSLSTGESSAVDGTRVCSMTGENVPLASVVESFEGWMKKKIQVDADVVTTRSASFELESDSWASLLNSVAAEYELDVTYHKQSDHYQISAQSK